MMAEKNDGIQTPPFFEIPPLRHSFFLFSLLSPPQLYLVYYLVTLNFFFLFTMSDCSCCRFEDKISNTPAAAPPAPAHDHHSHSHDHTHGHGHTHEDLDHPGHYHERPKAEYVNRDWSERAFTVGIGG